MILMKESTPTLRSSTKRMLHDTEVDFLKSYNFLSKEMLYNSWPNQGFGLHP